MTTKRVRLKSGEVGTVDDLGNFTPDEAAPTAPEPETPGFVTQEAPTAPTGGVSRTESALRGVSQGATLGWGDELGAAGIGLVDATFGVDPALQNRQDSRGRSNYERLRDQLRSENTEAQEANPGTYLGGQVAGGLLTQAPAMAATGGAASIPSLMGQGAALGAASGAGASEADNASDVAWDAMEGGLAGAALPVVGGAVASAARPLANAARGAERAGYRRVAAGAGLDKTAARKMVKRSGASSVEDAFEQYGRDIEGLGINQSGGLRPPTFGQQAERAGLVAEREGGRMGEVAGAVTQAGGMVTIDPFVAQGVMSKMRSGLRSAQPEIRAAAVELRDAMEAAGEGNAPSISFQNAWRLRQGINSFRKPLQTSHQGNEINALADSLESSLRQTIEGVDPALRQRWQQHGKNYAISKPLAEAGESRETAEQINQLISLRNVPSSGAGAALGMMGGAAAGADAMLSGGVGAGAAFLGNQALRGRGHQTSAAALHALSRELQSGAMAANTTGQRLATGGARVAGVSGSEGSQALDTRPRDAQPASTRSPSDSIRDRLRTDPQSFGPYAQRLQEAEQSGDEIAMPVLHHRLMQTDPTYRAMYERSQPGATQ